MTHQDRLKSVPANKGERENIVTAAKEGGIGFLGKLAVQIISLVFVFIMTRTYGAADYGLYRLAVLIITITAAISMIGLNGGLKRYVAIARTENNQPQLWGTIQLGIGLPLAIGLFLSLVLMLFAKLISIQIFDEPELAGILRIACCAIPFLVLVHSLTSIAIGFKKLVYNVYTEDLAFNVLKLIFCVVVIFFGLGIEIMMIAYVAAIIFSVLILFYFINKLFPFQKLPDRTERRDKEILWYSFPLFLSLLLNQFGRNLESIVLGAFGIISDVGVYSVILTLSNVGNMGFVALRTISNPIFAELYHEKRFEELKSYYQTVNRWSLSFNLPIFLIIVIFPDNIMAIFGKEFSVGTNALVILAFGNLFNAATGACGALLNMSGYSRLNFYNSCAYLISTIILDFILIPKYGLIGAALAGGLTFIIMNSLMMVEVYILVERILPFNRTLYKSVIAATLAGVLAFYAKNYLLVIDNPFIELAIIGIVMLAVYMVVLKALKFTPEDQIILKRIVNIVKRKK